MFFGAECLHTFWYLFCLSSYPVSSKLYIQIADMLVHVPMDSVVGRVIPAAGTDATVRGYFDGW